MSDYLTRLIERSMGVGPQIEPLIAPLHSPPEQVLIDPGETVVAASGAGARAKSETALGDVTPDDVGNSESGEASFPRAASLPRSTAGRFSQAPAQFAAGSDPPGPKPRGPASQTPSAPIPGGLHAASSPVASPLIPQRSGRAAPRPEITEGPRRVPASRELSPNKGRPVVQPAFIGQRRAAAPSSEPREQLAANQPPAIHVTIGRVEVRAVMAPGPPPKAATPPGPKISLEEYLKQRNGGRS